MEKKNIYRIILKNALLIVCFVLYSLILRILNISCPFFEIFGMPCPTCGVTRSLLSLVKFDFEGYRNYNPFSLFLCISVLIIFNLDLFKKRRLAMFFSFGVLIANFIFYLFKFYGQATALI